MSIKPRRLLSATRGKIGREGAFQRHHLVEELSAKGNSVAEASWCRIGFTASPIAYVAVKGPFHRQRCARGTAAQRSATVKLSRRHVTIYLESRWTSGSAPWPSRSAKLRPRVALLCTPAAIPYAGWVRTTARACSTRLRTRAPGLTAGRVNASAAVLRVIDIELIVPRRAQGWRALLRASGSNHLSRGTNSHKDHLFPEEANIGSARPWARSIDK